MASSRAARARREHEAAAAPDEMPLFADEDLFTSLFEGPTSFYVMATLRDGAVRVPVHFERREGTGSTEWVDPAYVVPRDRGTLQQRLRP